MYGLGYSVLLTGSRSSVVNDKIGYYCCNDSKSQQHSEQEKADSQKCLHAQ